MQVKLVAEFSAAKSQTARLYNELRLNSLNFDVRRTCYCIYSTESNR